MNDGSPYLQMTAKPLGLIRCGSSSSRHLSRVGYGVLMPSTPLAYRGSFHVVSRRFASSLFVFLQVTGIFAAGSIPGSSTVGGQELSGLGARFDHRAVADDHQDLAVPHREVARKHRFGSLKWAMRREPLQALSYGASARLSGCSERPLPTACAPVL